MDQRKPRIALIWSRFGPYHAARLAGVYQQARGSARISGIEIAETDAQYDWEPSESECGTRRHVVFPGRSYHDLTKKEIGSELLNVLDELSPDVLSINGWAAPEARAALSWAQRAKVRTILMSETKEDDSRRWWLKERLKRAYVRKFNSALVGGTQQKRYLVKLGMSPNSIRLGYDIVDNSHFSTGAEAARQNQSTLRRRLGLPQQYFFACTRLLPRKNVDGLLAAYAAYSAAVRNPWHLVIAGSGPEFDRLRGIEKSMLVDGVIWLGFVQYPQLPLYYGLASAFIHAAKAEAWGLVVNEAAASGLPILVSKTVGARYDLVKDNKSGLLFDPYCVDAISDCLLRISDYTSEAARREMGLNSAAVIKDWGPDRFGRELLRAAGLASTQQTPNSTGA